jgi:hypothetical protein
MIILKATQDKVLSVLQSVAGIVERRHTLPILGNVLLRKTGAGFLAQSSQAVPSPMLAFRPLLTPAARRVGTGGVSSTLRPNGFFSAGKANLRNAP